MSNNPSKFLGQLEKEVMDVIWASSELITVRTVFETISKKRKIAYTTVMTIMGRLSKKGLLKQIAVGKTYHYEARYSKETFLTKLSRQILKNLSSSFGDVAIASFTQELEKIPTDKRKRILKMLKKTTKII